MTTYNGLWRVWDDHPALQLKSTQMTIKGWSQAGLRTGFYIRELNILLDAGISASYQASAIFVTHGHSDHMANLPFHLITDNTSPTVYVPAASIDLFREWILAMFRLTHNTPDTPLPCNLVGATPGERIPVTLGGGRRFEVLIIECDHRVPCCGFGFIEIRKKLNPKYVGMSGKEIGAMRKAGVDDVYVESKHPSFCYMGDTGAAVLTRSEIFTFEHLMIECTFILEEDYELATKTKHMHWRDLAPAVIAHPDTHFILYHFSRRYKPTDIEKFFADLALPNVYAWVS